MDSELRKLVDEVDAYLTATGMAPTRFGIVTVNDRAAVIRMKQGRPLTTTKVSKMREYMASNPPPAARRQRQVSERPARGM